MADDAPEIPNPYLRGNFAPVRNELTVEGPLPLEGALPPGLEGRLVRIGPNPATAPSPSSYHWSAGDGMVHVIELRQGAAVSYRNRWVRTRALSRVVDTPPPPGPVEPVDSPANGHAVSIGGQLLALAESGLPHRLTGTGGTVRVEDFGARLASPMTAHPHRDPESGATAFFGYDPFGPPYLRYHELDGEGHLVHSTAVDLPRCTLQHDFGVTASRVAFLDLPAVLDPDLEAAGRADPFRWMPEAGARVGVLERGGEGAGTAWTAVEPSFVSHVMNAFDDGDAVVIDVCRYGHRAGSAPGQPDGPFATGAPHLQRWRVDPHRGRIDITDLDDRPVELPRVDPACVGRPYRYGYCVETSTDDTTGNVTGFVGLVRYDFVRDEAHHRHFEGRSPGEPIFVRAPDGCADDEGWVLTVVYDPWRDASDLVVLDASSFGAEPVAVVHLPARVPFGFHGSWTAADEYR